MEKTIVFNYFNYSNYSNSLKINYFCIMEQRETDERYMRRCLQLASNGRQNAKPNPMVGAVIVSREGRVIGEGFHVRCGEGHAEVNAFASVKPEDEALLAEATMYVSLEPCAHYGRTPPCADLIVRKGVRRVVVGCVDPFAKVHGLGVKKLLDAGGDVTVGVLERECLELNKHFVTFNERHRPYVLLKWCMSADGFLDDNFFGCSKWRELIEPVIKSKKRFQFKQGLDERLLTKERILEISKWKYDGEFIFAFDNIEDKDLIISKLKLIRETVPDWKRELKFYVFCGCDRNGIYDEQFWEKDITNLFERIDILSRFGAKPYIMRFEKVYDTQYSSFYAAVAAWCNQPSIFNTFTFRLFCQCRGMRKNGYKLYKRDVEGYLRDIGKKGSEWRAMEEIEKQFPAIAARYFDFDGKSNRR